MAWVTSARMAPPATAWASTAPVASPLMKALPAIAATTPATSTVDHSRKMARFEKPARRSMPALAAASGMPPRNMPMIRVTDRLS